MNTKPTGLAVIGLGMAAKPHLEALALLGDEITVTGIHNRSRTRADEVAAKYGYRVFDSIAEIAADPATEGVILLTPPHQRHDIVTTLAGAGKHILSEKPVERTLAAALEIVDICERAKVKLGIVFQHRFRAGAKRLTELVRAGELGDIAIVRTEIPWWRDQAYYDVPGRGTYQRDGGGVLISQAIHVLDLMLSLAGQVSAVQAMCATTMLHNLEAEDFAAAGVRYVSGAVGSIVATTASYPGGEEKIAIDGTKATAILEGGRLEVTWRDGRKETLGEPVVAGGGADPMAFPCDWHRDLISDFAAAIRNDTSPMIRGRDALLVHSLIDAMVTSSKTGRIVDVAQHEAG